jgi:hypothetical protein
LSLFCWGEKLCWEFCHNTQFWNFWDTREGGRNSGMKVIRGTKESVHVLSMTMNERPTWVFNHFEVVTWRNPKSTIHLFFVHSFVVTIFTSPLSLLLFQMDWHGWLYKGVHMMYTKEIQMYSTSNQSNKSVLSWLTDSIFKW